MKEEVEQVEEDEGEEEQKEEDEGKEEQKEDERGRGGREGREVRFAKRDYRM